MESRLINNSGENMAYTINTNITSLQAMEYLRLTTAFQGKTINRVTSGLRIVSSGDDAAGLAIANSIRSDRAVLTQGVRNANDGLSTLQTIDGGINNISQLLDRARTLAAQSASGTFTGDRNVVNSEFQSVLSEIDRQAQAIGLDTGGAFAKSLTVFIGGGRSNAGISAISNGSVAVDLSASTVDASSLGLKGVEVSGVADTDIGSGAASTNVQAILENAVNLADLTTADYTDFVFRGPGFADSDSVRVSLNIQGITDTASLVTGLNAAIESAGNAGTQAATALKNANVVASINTDSAGKKQLTFSSSNAAFQVQAGDKMASALLGNYTSTSNPEGKSMSTTVTGHAASAAGVSTFGATGAGDIVFRLQGAGMTSPVNVTVTVVAGTTVTEAIADLSAQVANDSTLKAAGITLTGSAAGANLVFTSIRGESFDVQVTGDVQDHFGLGSFKTGSASAFDYATITGSAYDNTTAYGSAVMQFSINGADSSGNAVTVDLTAGDAAAALITGTATSAGTILTTAHNTLSLTVDGVTNTISVTEAASATITAIIGQLNADIVTQFGSQVATFGLAANGRVTVTNTTLGAGGTVSVAQAGSHVLATTALHLDGETDTGESRTGASIVAAFNDAFATDTEMAAAGLEATFSGGNVVFTSSNDTYFRVNPDASGANADLGFGVTGASFAGQTVSAAPTASVQFNSGGASVSSALTFSPHAYGADDQTITISANNTAGNPQVVSIALQNDATNRYGRNIDQILDKINADLQQSNNTTLQQIVAVKVNDAGTEKIQFLSTLGSFNVTISNTASGNGVGSQGTTDSSTVSSGGSTAGVDTQAGAEAAVSALATSMDILGAAQAVVGKGQNRFNFAVTLAQTQLNNLAASESRIRDADLALEAANLTKAQIMQQAGIAAMAAAFFLPGPRAAPLEAAGGSEANWGS
jgi:flagellin